MKKLIFILAVLIGAAVSARADGGAHRVGIGAGASLYNTLHAQVSLEHDLRYGNVLEVFAEAGDRWQQPTCHMFWKRYYWDGGVAYKHRIWRGKNSSLRLRLDFHAGAAMRRVFIGFDPGVEWEHVFANGLRLYVQESNDFNFFHGDKFRNGLTVGLKFPL